MSAAPWAKIWWDWYASRSHLGVSGVALALGAPLMLICRESVWRNSDANSDGNSDASCDAQCDSVVIVHKGGKPMTAATLAPIVRFSVEQVQSALDELVAAETLSVSSDGAYCFPNFWRYQESAAAARMRALRKKPKRNSDANSDAQCDDKRTEDRGQRSEEEEFPRKTPKAPSVPLAVPTPDDVAKQSERIRELEGRYPVGIAGEARQACSMSRRNGKMADSLWLAVLEKFAKHPADAVERAMRTFCERYADGQKDERYLLGIVRGEARMPSGAPANTNSAPKTVKGLRAAASELVLSGDTAGANRLLAEARELEDAEERKARGWGRR